MNQFFDDKPEAGAGEQYRDQAIETVEYNIYWVETNVPDIEDWLKNNT